MMFGFREALLMKVGVGNRRLDLRRKDSEKSSTSPPTLFLFSAPPPPALPVHDQGPTRSLPSQAFYMIDDLSDWQPHGPTQLAWTKEIAFDTRSYPDNPRDLTSPAGSARMHLPYLSCDTRRQAREYRAGLSVCIWNCGD